MIKLAMKKVDRKTSMHAHFAMAFSACLTMCMFSQDANAQPVKTPIIKLQTITATTVQSVKWPQSLQASGQVAAWHEAVISARTASQPLVSVLADVGTSVKAGQELARFDDRIAKAELAQSIAQLDQATANAKQAQVNHDRMQTLRGTGAVSEDSLLQASTAAETASAQVGLAKANAEAAQIRLNNTVVLSPDSGVISSRNASLGLAVNNGAELFRLIRQDRLEWRAEVSVEKLSQIKIGQSGEIQLPEGQLIKGKVRLVAPTLDNKTRLGTVHLDLEKSQVAKPAMFVDGRITLGQSLALVVPSESVVIKDGRAYVFLIEKNRVRQVSVTTGRRVKNKTEISGEIKADDLVAVRGAGFLADGNAVNIQKDSNESRSN